MDASLFDDRSALGLQRRLALAYPAGRGLVRRIAAAILITWEPLAVLAAIQGLAHRPNPRESFLLDRLEYARFWIAVTLLIAAERVTLPLLNRIASEFAPHSLPRERLTLIGPPSRPCSRRPGDGRSDALLVG